MMLSPARPPRPLPLTLAALLGMMFILVPPSISGPPSPALAASAATAMDELPERLTAPQQVELITADEFEQLLEFHRGKVILVNLWATWCIPCVQELPDLNLLQKRYRDKGLTVLALSRRGV